MKSKLKDDGGLDAAARVAAAGGRVPKKFLKARPVSAGPTLAAKESQAKLSAARRVAFEVLMLVGQQKGHSDELLHGQRMDGLSEADRNLATALVMGVLRWQIALDARLKLLLQRPEQRLAEGVSIALRMGAFQLLHMDRIPAHAALSESVELCKAAGEPHAAGMVNAILRKVVAARPASVAVEPISQTRDVGRPELTPDFSPVSAPIFERTAVFAERLGHSAWLVERWVKAYGREAALAICEADQQEPDGGKLFEPDAALPLMDDGSRLVAEIAAKAMPEGGTRVWDCCAAPGGKTLVLAARLAGAEVLATDVSVKRLGGMRARLRGDAAAANVRLAVADATELPAEAGLFDLILCDVPCSGTGTLGRNPEIRLRLEEPELKRQADRQRAILAAALKRLAPGGRLVYSTCSLEPEENERIVEGMRRVSVAEFLPAGVELRDGVVKDGCLRTIPGVDGVDGFFAAVLERQ